VNLPLECYRAWVAARVAEDDIESIKEVAAAYRQLGSLAGEYPACLDYAAFADWLLSAAKEAAMKRLQTIQAECEHDGDWTLAEERKYGTNIYQCEQCGKLEHKLATAVEANRAK
jgi:hypothetical protein